jgi:hypothetical protein
MRNQNRLLACAFALATILPGCKPSTPAGSTTEQVPTPVTDSGPAVASGQTVLELGSADAKVRTQVGTKDQGVLTATGKNGVLAFGPYLPLGAGKYTVTVKGSTSTPFSLDVVSDAGKTIHAQKQFAAQESAETLATLPFDLAAPAQHVEIRLIVPQGSDAKLVGYKVISR